MLDPLAMAKLANSFQSICHDLWSRSKSGKVQVEDGIQSDKLVWKIYIYVFGSCYNQLNLNHFLLCHPFAWGRFEEILFVVS